MLTTLTGHLPGAQSAVQLRRREQQLVIRQEPGRR